MNVLLVVPHYPDSYWTFKTILPYVGKKAACPPLGMLTVSALLPKPWNKKLVNLNIEPLQINDILWADYVFIGAMYIQKKSVAQIINLCLKYNIKMVAGGPLFTQEYENYPQIDHFVLNEAEITLPLFLSDLRAGVPKKVYRTDEYSDLALTPAPDYGLLPLKDYVFTSIQVSRGCPFSCEFCEISVLQGRKARMKSTRQVIEELDALYKMNWRGHVLIVDDNFIGNKSELKKNLLPAMKAWMKQHGFPFTFNTQASLNLADDDELMTLMVETGFSSVFIGIETPEEKSLLESNKTQNLNRNLVQSVRKMQNAGLQVSAGLIVGFDSDTESTFQRQIDFIQESGIVTAMIGLLNAPKKTPLYRRYEAENRIISEASGNNTDLTLNYIPVMDAEVLVAGYQRILKEIYSPGPYYKRIKQFLRNYNPNPKLPAEIGIVAFVTFVKSLYALGIRDPGWWRYWSLLLWTLFSRPHLLSDAVSFSLYGLHFRKLFGIR
ncbi:MAG: B12-binding domain-containing radical SAM protein [Desulfatirhabdiaceae bacterium]|nr:B12-binding domain-containing radical SAM protein [Desulfatirhabdiaceae bacterium]